MKRFAAGVLAILFLCVPALSGVAAQVQAQPNPLQPAQEPPRLRLDLDQVNPRLIDSNSTTLTVSGKVTNIGDRRISKLQVQLQVGEREATERQFTDALAGNPFNDVSRSGFQPLSDTLEPGQSAPLLVTVPVVGGGLRTLQLTKPGVYPLLVNVNGTPEFSGQARLGAVSMLLPVLGAPGKPKPSSPPKPAGLSLLWPFTDSVPHVTSAPFGGAMTMDDDRLADALSQGGRLYSLLTAARTAQDDSRLSTALCFAIDPDLIQTVDAMTRGYQVRTGSGPVQGKGVGVAKDWLAGLKALVAGHCTVTMPFADADLTALTKVRAGGTPDTALVGEALGGPAVIQKLLGVQPREGVLWPDGTLDAQAQAALAKAGVKTVLTDSGKLQTSSPVTGAVTLADSGLRAQPIDSLISSALSGTTVASAATSTTTSTALPQIATENGLAALAFRAGLGGTATPQQRGQFLVAPPRRWDIPQVELTNFVQRLRDYLDAGLVTATGLPQLLDKDPAGTASANDSIGELTATTSADVLNAMSAIDRDAAGLTSAMTVDVGTRVQPADLIGPVRTGLLRASSTAWRGVAGADTATANAQAELDALRGQVTIDQPRQTIALASGASPLPVHVTNGLPVGITVRIALGNNAGLRPETVSDRPFPANGALNLYIPVEALRAGRFSVDVSLSTPAGTKLGSATRFELTSTEYGAITIIVTVVAGAALLLLSARRIYRRVKESKASKLAKETEHAGV
ncbi:DUF6049 family protein [Amycolatopsis sp. H20-H5]|uniref:DUF6049 family protein n=1 Tax=Amycolatopsis sp. H20-H5 TaxID=3046309 RepID=UPI002DB9C68E|nr:DUF6049 family protein [Amycolatopsis sp. H20-H5]MEC3974632.1 DUF6049 family protein [Amycolatopsis sp. H20-H5]